MRLNSVQKIGLLILLILFLLLPTDNLSVGLSKSRDSKVLISAIYYDGYLKDEIDEAFQLVNIGNREIDISGWKVTDNEGGAAFPDKTIIKSGEKVWCAQNALAFKKIFGFMPEFEYGDDSDLQVRNMSKAPNMNSPKLLKFNTNDGDELVLLNDVGKPIDTLVYKEGDSNQPGWKGKPIEPYSVYHKTSIILYRKLNQSTGLPVPDTDTLNDWAQAPDDPINGRKVLYPGWDLDKFFQTFKVTEEADLTVLVAPDNIYEGVKSYLDTAQESVFIETQTFEHLGLANLVIHKAKEGVKVRVLLEGDPPGGITNQMKWISQKIEEAGGKVYFMVDKLNDGIADRYEYLHDKLIIIDEKILIIGSENLGYGGMPNDDKTDGTRGHRGTAIVTNAPSLVNHALQIFNADLDLDHKDIFRFSPDHEKYGAPPDDFAPCTINGGSAYQLVKPEPLTLHGTFDFELISSPESSLRDQDSLLGMLSQASDGDTILVEQLYERTYWGSSNSSPEEDPNPRLEAYIDAARHGAKVRILLDKYFADPLSPRGNVATCNYVNKIAEEEGLDIEVRLANPTGGKPSPEIGKKLLNKPLECIEKVLDQQGIHNKMVLAKIGDNGYVHIGSINGSETSSKINRELAVQIQSNEAYQYLADVFNYDWNTSDRCQVYEE